MSRPPRPTSSSRSDCSGGVFDWAVALRRLDELNARVEDPTLWDDADAAQGLMRERTRLAARAELEALLSGEADGNDCFMEINAGAGGTESNDWANMLLRMYTRWAQ